MLFAGFLERKGFSRFSGRCGIPVCFRLGITVLLSLASCGGRGEAPKATGETTMTIFCVGSLDRGISIVAESFKEQHPQTEIRIESSGSRVALHKWLQLGRYVDVIALADCRALTEEAMPRHTDWGLAFAGNQMVIAYTERSKFTSEINAENWYKILARPGVEVGRSDPNKDPCGYRALMLLQLADLYYGVVERDNKSIYQTVLANSSPNNVRPEAMELGPLLQSRQLDFAFEYLSFAIQHNLKHIELPGQINLGDPRYEDFYAKATVKISGEKPGETVVYHGSSIAYGLTINSGSKVPDLAQEFVVYLLGPEGRRIFEAEGMPMLESYKLYGTNPPEQLRRFLSAK